MIDGQPVTDGIIRFVPEEGRAAMSGIDENGRFSLTCYAPDDGALIGTHKVGVQAIEPLGGDRRRWLAPKKYANYKTSGITQQIDGPVDDLVFELTWDGGKPFIEN